VNRLFSLAATVALGAACTAGGGGAGGPDATAPRNPGGGSDAWTPQTAVTGGVGLNLRMVLDGSGRARLAYFPTTGTLDGPCDELGSQDPPMRMRWQLSYVEEPSAGGAWQPEQVADALFVGQPPGLDLRTAPNGAPAIAAMVGDPVVEIRYCGANDVGYLQRAGDGTWSTQTAVADSGEAATGQPASDFGYVVGYWPGLAYDSTGAAAIAYKDVHAGSLQGDDLRRADLELAWRDGGGWRAIPVDIGEGAGEYNRLAFDGDGRPLILYANRVEAIADDQQGLWVTRSSDSGATWERVRLLVGPVGDDHSIVVPDDGRPRVAYYHPDRGVPYLVELTDPAAFASLGSGWSEQALGDPRYDEGYEPSLAVAGDGRLAMAYYRCGRATNGLGNCDTADDALIFAWEETPGSWEQEIVDEGEDLAECGRSPSLAFGPDGAAVIAYRCQAMVDGALDDQVRVARRDPL